MTTLPSGWQPRRLIDIAGKPQYGWTSPARPEGSGYPMLRTTDITGGPVEWSSVPRALTAPNDPDRYLLRDGDIVVSRAGSVGVSAVVKSPPPAIFASYLMRVRPGPEVETGFLQLFLLSPQYWDQISSVTDGIAIPNINGSKLSAVSVPLPPLDEQRRIVEILEDHLSRLDSGARLTRTALRRMVGFRQSSRQSAVDQMHGEMVPLGDLVERVETGRSLGGSAPPAADDEWGIIKVSAMTWGAFRPGENKRIPDHLANPRYEVRPGDLLVSRANTSAYVGASVVVGDIRSRLLLSDKSLRLVPRPDVSSLWLNEVLQAPRTREQISALATGTKDSMRNISQKALLSVRIPRAALVDQLAMVARCEESAREIDRLSAALGGAERRAELLRRSLLAAAFSGSLTGSSSDNARAEELAGVGA